MTESQTYFSLSREDKIDALEVAASKLGRPADLLEKDVCVAWVLNALFDSDLGEHLVFKGGTSLSKVYKAIDRFSEDVDLTYDIRQIIPDLIKDPDDPYPPSRSQAQKWTEAVRDRLGEWVGSIVAPMLSDKVSAAALPAEIRVEGDKIYLDYDAVRSGSGYVRSSVLLEFGARSTGEPAQRHEVICDLSEALPELLTLVATPRVMMAERTFWEKATAIHAYCMRGGDRYARHWYDLERLQAVGIAARALEDKTLAQDVAKHKQHFFRETDRAGATINYADAVSGSLCLIPEGAPLEALAQDYQKMQEAGLLQSDAIAFDDLMARLMDLQDQANKRAE
ncbi:nucleotidyl transferase AbiEii/AbiGii toxin family protein [Tritonibacter horizontis]|uniref:Nucleotidyl transferase AbiEii toxin, Type IV TA system n=1 Tax=Tritonibacter horizontis TaxID=1768241 RepID=A0A132C0C9_9RHOB|nr:nucleotidyl transferase AbiEii/AbiGii toxin family protein [Tritonibacter horizontis]KUP94034.1 hypothetical protein TRIHO_10590 [Tritonibacter horizontis]